MFCPNCGARNSEADTTCQKCGFNLKEAAGAKFKGTMLMMNNPAAAELRRSVPPAGAAAPPVNPPAGYPGATSAQSPTAPNEAQQRAKLKGTMIGVAPPAAALNLPPQPGAPAARQPSAAPGPLQPTPAQPGVPHMGPGQVNAPGAGMHRAGGTMIGTGIGVPGQYLRPNPTQPAHAPTELQPVSMQPVGPTAPQVPQSFPGQSAAGTAASTYGVGVPNPNAAGSHITGLSNQIDPAGTVRSAVDPHPLAQTQVAAGTNESASAGAPPAYIAAGYPEPAATRAMNQFDQAVPQRPVNTLEGTMVAGGIPTASRTDSMPQVAPQFSAQAGNRTDTPAMGMPAATGANYGSSSQTGAGQSKGKSILLTVITCGLYQLFKKTK